MVYVESIKLDFVHLRGVGEDVGELSVNCGWGFSAVGFQPRQWNISVGQPQHEVGRSGHVSKFCAKSRQSVTDNPDCLQPDVKIHIDQADGRSVANLITYLENAGRITRTRNGRKILLNIP